MKIKAVFLSILLCSALILPAQVKVTKGLAELDFDKNLSGKAAWQNIYITAIVYPQLQYSVKACEIISNLQKKHPARLKVFAIVPDTVANAQKFAAQNPELDLTVCADEKFQETSKLLGANFQQCSIFNRSGKLLWSGEAIDLDMMVKKILANHYSEQEEARIAALTSALQASLRSGNPAMIIQSADRILALRDVQLSAVNAKAYALEMSGDFAGLEKFFRERIKKYPQEPANYFMLIEASFRHPALNRTAPAIAIEYFKKFPENSTEINAICWSLLNQMPYSAEAFAAVCAGEKLLQKSAAANGSRILVTRSLIAYRKCDLKMANHYAKKAQSAARNATDKAFINELLKYYQAVKK